MMSAPVVNTSLPPPSTPTPAGPVPPLPLTVSPVKVAPPSPPVNKPQPPTPPQILNHNASAPLSLVNENKAKSPEKTKEAPVAPPTSNGVDEAPATKTVVNTPVEEPVAAPVVPPQVNHAEEPPCTVDTPAPAPAPTPAINPEPTQVAPPNETPKPAKPQAAKRRRETPPATAPESDGAAPEKKPRRRRAPVHHYQSPLPEIVTVINRSLKIKDNSDKSTDEKIIVFYKNEFLAVRNSEGGYYLCQTLQNIYRTSHKIRIRWLSRDEKEEDETGGIYTRDFYDTTDFECILTSVALQKQDRNKYKLKPAELDRVERILKRSLDVEKGEGKPDLTEEHPDGVDVTLYRDESQLQKAKNSPKRKRSTARKPKSPKRAKRAKKETTTKKKVKKPKRNDTPRMSTSPYRPPKKPARSERSSVRDRAKVEPLKLSIPNEKARVVAKVMRKLDSTPTKADKPKSKTKPNVGQKKAAPVAPTKTAKAAQKKAEAAGRNKKKVKASPASSKKNDKSEKKVVESPRVSERRGAVSTRKRGRK